MNTIQKVLRGYSIRPTYIEKITDRLYKVSDSHYTFAVKKSSLTMEVISTWEKVYHEAYSKNITYVLPVYLTAEGKLYLELDQKIWYISPWIERKQIDDKTAINNIYSCIGKLHHSTKQPQPFDSPKALREFRDYKTSFCEKIQENLLSYVEHFEKSRYMSPFELQVCSQYRDIEMILKELNKRVDQLIEELQNQSEWNTSLCHGQLKFSHMVHNENTSLLNWEKAYIGNSISDLSYLYKEQATYYDNHTELLIEQFSTYINENNLSKYELLLLAIYLLDPSSYISNVNAYTKNTTTTTMIEKNKRLQRAYRQLIFGFKWSQKAETLIEPDLFDESLES
ncbi:hypothetical protein ACFQ3N_14180 [Virgibacillus byunsanensis]|uniref:Aminoglycoside phosphotransferase domain-containing protein n=1 Tax=Virgibacillus byunsanensis TaxID=570945 RepID=A0ABW3LQK8_9BACI